MPPHHDDMDGLDDLDRRLVADQDDSHPVYYAPAERADRLYRPGM